MIDKEAIINAVKAEAEKANEIFFGYAWRAKIENWLEEESRYTELARWIEKQIDGFKRVAMTFCPADRTKDYTMEDYKTYRQAIADFAMLTQLRDCLFDKQCSEKQRANIEYTVCKAFNIHWNEQLKKYV